MICDVEKGIIYYYYYIFYMLNKILITSTGKKTATEFAIFKKQ